METKQYTMGFSDSEDLCILPNQSLQSRPPAMVTTSPKGDLLVLLELQRDLGDYSEKLFLIVLFPYISSCKMMDDSTMQLLDGTYTTFWEIEGMEHVTHLAMDKLGIIYFTTGESLYRINKTEGDMYLDTFEDIFTPSNDTSHITCLWRQSNDVYLTIQDWDNEESLDLYKVIPPKDKGVASPGDGTPDHHQHRGHSPSFGSRGHSPRHSGHHKRRSRSRSGSTGYGSDYASSPRGRGTANDSNLFVNKVRTFSLSYNSRIWQLGTMRFEKKMLLAVGAAQLGSAPLVLQIGFKKKINALAMGTGKNMKSVIWPRSVPDQVPHSIEFHKATKTWFCMLPVIKGKSDDGALYWIQFKMDKTKKKVTWSRLIPLPKDAMEGDWLYYDELRDVLIGFARADDADKQYVFKFLPDLTKHLWIEFDDEEDATHSKGPQLQRANPKLKKMKSVKDTKESKENKDSKNTVAKNDHAATPSTESNIKPSKAKGKLSKKRKSKKEEKVKTKEQTKEKTKGKKAKERVVQHSQSGSRGSMALNDIKKKKKVETMTKTDAAKKKKKKKKKSTDAVKKEEGKPSAEMDEDGNEDVDDDEKEEEEEFVMD